MNQGHTNNDGTGLRPGDSCTIGGIGYVVDTCLPQGYCRGYRDDDPALTFVFHNTPLEHSDIWQAVAQDRSAYGPRHPMFPELVHAGDDGAVLEDVAGDPVPTGLPLPRAIRILEEVRREMRFLAAAMHAAVTDIQPDDLRLTEDGRTRLRCFPALSPFEPPTRTRRGHVPAADQASERNCVFVWGALLYTLVTGSPFPSKGLDYTAIASLQVPGLPQLLYATVGGSDSLMQGAGLRNRPSVLLALGKACKAMVRPALPRYRIGAATTIGRNTGRLYNEDAYGIVEGLIECHETSERLIRACIADGCGGDWHGEMASHAAVHAFCHGPGPQALEEPAEQAQWTRSLGWNAHDAVLRHTVEGTDGFCRFFRDGERVTQPHDCCMRVASGWVCTITEPHDCCMRTTRHGTTTLTGVVVLDDRLTMAHVGDSRAYLHSQARGLELLSVDHTEGGGLERVLGDTRTETLPADYVDTLANRPSPEGEQKPLGKPHALPWLTLAIGDLVVLVSDGVWGAWRPRGGFWGLFDNDDTPEIRFPDVLARVIADADGDPQSVADTLIERVLETRADDNATVVAVQRTA
ncbi:MAG: protein phosphatase 2C domain-containing protein [Caldilineaceae bacterium]|nr:protein phosphatase 2C domain-containing protein [Caldilineaceae bacterium]